MLIIVSFRVENVEKKSTLKLLALRRLKVSSSHLEFGMGQVPFYFLPFVKSIKVLEKK